MTTVTPTVQTWHATAVGRARDFKLRLSVCLLIAMFALHLIGGVWPLAWLAASIAAQFVIGAVLEPARQDAGFRFGRRRELLFYASLTLSASIYTLIGALLWFAGGHVGRLCSFVVLAGGAINVALTAKASPRQLWVSQAPFFLVMPGLPLLEFARVGGAERDLMALVSLCALVFTLYLAMAGHRGVAAAGAVSRALTEARRAQARAEAADAAKGEFLSAVSHELRTPLNGVLGMAQIMDGDELTSPQRERLGVIKQSGDALLVLVNDLLDIARLEDETLELSDGLIDLPQLAAQTEALFLPRARAKGLSFTVQLAPEAGVVRQGDPDRVRQVLHNLVGNAVKFTDQGSVSVMISGSPEALTLEVADTGAGIAPDRLPAVFERFTQSDGSASRRHGGPGIGLAITRGLARLMDGELSVRSQLGEGSTFTARLALPLKAAPRRLDLAAARSDEDGPVRVRILAAEDNPTNQLVLRTLLEQLGVDLHVVENGEDAISAFTDSPWDLVLMDIQMPRMDGLAAAKRIRELEVEEGRARTPILAVTANATTALTATYLAAGMDGLVPKPIHFAQLINAIAGVMASENDNLPRGRAGAA